MYWFRMRDIFGASVARPSGFSSSRSGNERPRPDSAPSLSISLLLLHQRSRRRGLGVSVAHPDSVSDPHSGGEKLQSMAMERAPYALITCLGTWAPWSEQVAGTTFEDFMQRTFGSTVLGAVPSQAQDMEFSCAHRTRSGSNIMIKGPIGLPHACRS